jgi:hypothetical protein
VATQLGLLDPREAAWTAPAGQAINIRESRRARHLIIQVVPPRTVEVVVPRGTRAREVERFVSEHRAWIEQACDELAARFGGAVSLPQTVELPAIGQRIDVLLTETAAASPSWRQRGSELSLRVPRGEGGAWSGLLRDWLLAQGRRHLKPWLGIEADRLGLAPKSVHVRLQRTRWGSCSARGIVSLNASLLLVAPELVRYLLVHELTHLRHMNHSAAYWRSVARFEPDCRALDRRLAAAWLELPGWVMLALGGT